MKAYEKIPEWNEINFRKPELDERNYFDSFDEDADGVYLSGTGDDMTGVTAWMPLPNPYKGE